MRSQEGKKKSIMWQESRKVGSSRCDREEDNGVDRRYFDSSEIVEMMI